MKNLYLICGIPVFFVFMLVSCSDKTTRNIALFSPDSLVRIECSVNDSLSGAFLYSVYFKDNQIIKASQIRIYLKNQPALENNFKIISVETDSVNENWERVWGKRKQVSNRYNSMVIGLRERHAPGRILNIHLRAYDDAIALRYEIPLQKGIDTILLSEDKIEFSFMNDHAVWAAFWNSFNISQEVEFSPVHLSDITSNNIIGTPILVNTDKVWVALMEADVTDWACSGFTAEENSPYTLVSKPSRRTDDSTLSVKTKSQRLSPWKVAIMSDSPGQLIESDIIQNLNDPCALEDVSWIKPGVSAWDWWWSGKYAPDRDFSLGPNTATMKYYIDFASQMGWQYQLVDWQWYGPPFKEDGSFNTDADITKMIPEIDIPEIVKYAHSKNVNTIIWLLWPNVNKQMDEAFALYEKWGVSGVKIDFMDRNDQEMVNFYHRVAETAARHQLVVDFHGAYVPDGFSRTYPNLITREGVLGNEYNKWSNRITPVHCLTLPFTRMLAGEMDFTPGGFLNDHPDKFVVVGGDSPAPHVMGTRCFQLAMFVVYESAFQVFCESPYNVKNQPGSDFLKGIPSTWDDTKVIGGMPGDFISIARRSGSKWYLAGMTVKERNFEVPADFLGNGNYKIILWADAPDAKSNPRKLVKTEFKISKSDVIKTGAAANGGFIAIIEPE